MAKTAIMIEGHGVRPATQKPLAYVRACARMNARAGSGLRPADAAAAEARALLTQAAGLLARAEALLERVAR